MFTMLIAGRSHIITDEAARLVKLALDEGRATETIAVEMNGPGSGTWVVTVNVNQVAALIRHPGHRSESSVEPASGLRVAPPRTRQG